MRRLAKHPKLSDIIGAPFTAERSARRPTTACFFSDTTVLPKAWNGSAKPETSWPVNASARPWKTRLGSTTLTEPYRCTSNRASWIWWFATAPAARSTRSKPWWPALLSSITTMTAGPTCSLPMARTWPHSKKPMRHSTTGCSGTTMTARFQMSPKESAWPVLGTRWELPQPITTTTAGWICSSPASAATRCTTIAVMEPSKM